MGDRRRQRGGGAATRVHLLLLLLLRPAGTAVAVGRSHQGDPLPHHGPVRASEEGRVKAWSSQRYGVAWHLTVRLWMAVIVSFAAM